MLRDVWPKRLLEDPSKQAIEVSSAEEFLRAVLIDNHIDDVVILPNGSNIMKLGWEDTVPVDLRNFLETCENGKNVAAGLLKNPKMLTSYQWRMDLHGGHSKFASTGECWDNKCNPTKEDDDMFRKSLSRVLNDDTLKSGDVYFAEVSTKKRWIRENRLLLSDDELPRHAVFSHDFKDIVGPLGLWNLVWASFDAGLFVGGRFSGMFEL